MEAGWIRRWNRSPVVAPALKISMASFAAWIAAATAIMTGTAIETVIMIETAITIEGTLRADLTRRVAAKSMLKAIHCGPSAKP